MTDRTDLDVGYGGSDSRPCVEMANGTIEAHLARMEAVTEGNGLFDLSGDRQVCHHCHQQNRYPKNAQENSEFLDHRRLC